MTIKEIAKLAGVSAATVSNVINNKTNKVSQETIDKINALIKEHQYIKNQSATTLVKKKSNLIGVIFPRTKEPFLENPFHSTILSGLEYSLTGKGYNLIPKPVSTYEELKTFIHNWTLDGLIILPIPDQIPESEYQLDLPVVLIDSYNGEDNRTIIRTDDFHSGYISTEHLIKNGHKDICFIGYVHYENSVISKRFEGYKKALEDYNIEFKEDSGIFVPYQLFEQDNYADLILERTKGYTAAATSADLIAIKVMHVLKSNGIDVPNDFSIIGFDNLLLTNYTTPRLTTVDQHVLEKGRKSGDLLVNIIENNAKPKVVVEPATVESRESVKKLN